MQQAKLGQGAKEGGGQARTPAGRPAMASPVARTAQSVSRSWSSAVAGIWRSVGGFLSSNLLQHRSYSDLGLDGPVSPSTEASSGADSLVHTVLSGKCPPAVPKAETFGAYRSVYERNADQRRKLERFRVCRAPYEVCKATVMAEVDHMLPSANLKPQLNWTSFNEEQSPVGNSRLASSNLAQKSCHDSPGRGFVSGRELPIGSACGAGNVHMPSASTTSLAIAILKHRQRQGIIIDSYAFVEILKRCLKQKDLIAATQVHDCIIQSGMDQHPYVATTLIDVYIKCGRLQDARRVFDGLEKKTGVTWSVMIGGYAKNDHLEDALEVFNRMRQGGAQPDALTCLTIVKACASPLALKWGKEVHAYVMQVGLESDLRLGTALVQMYGKCGYITEARIVFENLTNRDVCAWNVMIRAYAATGSIDDARLIFDRMKTRNVITWSIMIGAYAESGGGVEAYRFFLQMKREGFIPDAITYVSILNASASAGALEWVKDVHSHALKAGLESDLRVGNALVHMYAKSGSIDDARLVFERMEKRDIITWNTMIGGLAQHGCGHEALEIFRNMYADCMKPDGTSFVAVLSACCHAGLLDDGRKLFSTMTEDYSIEPTVVHYTCMVDLLARAGYLEEAKLFMGDMPVEPNSVTWQTFLGACRTYGNVELGELAFKELLKLEPKNASAYVLLSNIYATAGKREKVSLVRDMMHKRGVRKEPGYSWIEVDNRIHEFVVGDTFHPEAKAIQSELKRLTEKLQAEGYIPDTKLVLPNVDDEDKELGLCCHSEKLAIAYGLLRIPEGNPIRVFKNLRVCSDCHTATSFISKVTGREIIARDANRFHHFKKGVCSCGDYW